MCALLSAADEWHEEILSRVGGGWRMALGGDSRTLSEVRDRPFQVLEAM